VLLCEAIGRPELASDERFADFAARDRNRDALSEILDEVFAARTTVTWLDVLAAAGVPSSPVNDVAAALLDPQVEARASVVEYEHPTLGLVRQIATPLRLSGAAPPVVRAPFRGEHTGAD
jgi:crotonobetainyl-CoA:carnitine CoA-transferase CaiB-like acyl-CoA transferase